MLVIDDNMLKLAKMQETLLKMSSEDRQANLEKYKATVMEIDAQAFSSLLAELNQVNEHNRTLEDELKFLLQIKDYYNQLAELQLSFRRVCELYGDNELRLSDLSQINYEYIEKRVNTISGYLINLKNIESNKKSLQEFDRKLATETKNKEYLSKKLLEFECLLRDNFIAAEGRAIIDGKLQYIGIVTEYQEMGYDFKSLLVDDKTLESLLSSVNAERFEVEEKLKTAEICYNTNPNADSKQIYDEISVEFLRVRYRLTLLKVLQLLSQNYDDYDLFKEKREKILDLIKYRVACLEKLGFRISIDPFSRTKVSEQLTMISSLTDNSKVISEIITEKAQLGERIDEMIHQNEDYMDSIKDVQELLISRTSINDIDISGISIDVPVSVVERTVLDNQVVEVRNISDKLNMGIIKQKTAGVIRRVSEMVTSSVVEAKKEDNLSPELVIVPQVVVIDKEFEAQVSESLFDDLSVSFTTLTDEEDPLDDEETDDLEQSNNKLQGDALSTFNSDIFETVDPFAPTPLFTDRADESFVDLPKKDELVLPELDLQLVPKREETDLVLQFDNNDLDNAMPDAFWVTQGDDLEDDELEDEDSDDVVLTFEEQIKALVSGNEEDTKVKKLVA